MGKINLLDIETVNKIAAGEVVERPASAIKELIENAIDAGATKITVEIKNGGISYMRVTDNGSGIASDDIEKAFLPHSTSKIKSIDDLQSLYTMGFRGEALASIASVSNVSIITKTKDEMYGTAMNLEGGKIVSKQETGCPDGTTITVNNLFYNTPARLNFLKRDATEASHISEVVSRMIIGNPSISIRYISSGREVLFSPGNGNLKDAYASVYGRELAYSCAEINYNYNGIKVTGLAGLPFSARANRNMQDFFVNGRWVRSKTITHAGEQAYRTMLMVGKFPILFINVQLTPGKTDVNVHPSKLEIKFTDENAIHSAVFWAVQNAILNSEKIKDVDAPPKKTEEKSDFNVKSTLKKEEYSSPKKEVTEEIFNDELINVFKKKEQKEFEQGSFVTNNTFREDFVPMPENVENKEEIVFEEEKDENNFEVKGQIFDTYIIVQKDDKMLLIDQHAVHERMNYNKIVKNLSVNSQVLMIPENIIFSGKEKNLIFENSDVFYDMGFEIEDFGTSVIVRRIPDNIDVGDIKNTMLEISDIVSQGGDPEMIYDKARFTVACKSAIKANHKLSETEMYELANSAINDENIRTCPHGRPVVISLSKKFIEKEFKRIV